VRSVLRSSAFRRWSWLAIAALVVVGLVRNAVDDGSPRTVDDRVQAIASTLKCPVCRSQSVADSEVAAARAIRTEIERRVEAGEDDEDIRTAIADAYGDDVQLTPSGSGFAGLVWVVPVVALVLALAGLTATFARWRRRTAAVTSDEDRALVDAALRGR
jgi:cytochrome c-type biogenesis protein CcmH